MVREKTMTQTREYDESILNTLREPLIVLDQDLRVISVSRSFYGVFKVKPEETVGQLIYNLGDKQWDIPKLRELLETILPQKTSFDDYEVEHDFANIGRRIMLLNARQIVRGMGKERIILLAIEDITERKRLESFLAESEERYRRLFETASDAIVLLEKSEGKITHANPATEKMLGYTKKESIGNKLQDIGILPDIGDFQTTMQNLNKSGIIHYDDVPVKTKSGLHIDTDIYLVDRAKLVQCNIRDITDRKRAEEVLRESEKKYREILQSIEDGYFEVDIAGNLGFFNDSLCRILGYSHQEMRGMNNRQYMTPETSKKVFETFNEVYRTGRATKVFGWDLVRKDGQIRCVETSVSPLYGPTGDKIGFRGIARDVTERNRAEEERQRLEAQLQQAQKMETVGRLAGGVAHDFNNKLGIIIGNVEMAMLRVDPEEPFYNELNEILTAANRSGELVRQLLAFARKQTVSPKVVDLNATASGMLNMLRRLIGEDIDLVWMPGRDIWQVNIDPSQIDQILANLAVNARDAIAGVGTMTIETDNVTFDEEYCTDHLGSVPGQYVLLAVSDDGVGMSKDVLEHLFEPFFTTKEVGKGTGLGLSSIYGIVKQNDGFITVYSEPGEGTTFKIYLPRFEAETVEAKAEKAEETLKGGTEKVLMVEDEVAILKLGKRMLESLGYSVLTANTPQEAIGVAGQHSGAIHLLLTDVVMPEMNGRKLAEQLKLINPDLKCLYMSGYTSNVIAHRGVLDEGVHFIQKPFSIKDLAAKVREALDKV